MKIMLAIATIILVGETLSACSFYEPTPGGHVTFALGYDYSHEDDPVSGFYPDYVHKPY